MVSKYIKQSSTTIGIHNKCVSMTNKLNESGTDRNIPRSFITQLVYTNKGTLLFYEYSVRHYRLGPQLLFMLFPL